MEQDKGSGCIAEVLRDYRGIITIGEFDLPYILISSFSGGNLAVPTRGKIHLGREGLILPMGYKTSELHEGFDKDELLENLLGAWRRNNKFSNNSSLSKPSCNSEVLYPKGKINP